MTIKTHRPLPMRPSDMSSDKNAEKKYAFLSMETRPDYRPLEVSSKPLDVSKNKKFGYLKINENN